MIDIPIQIPGLARKQKSIGPLHVVAGFFLIANTETVYRVFNLQSHVALIPVYIVSALSLAYGLGRKKFDPAYKFNFPLRMLQALTFLLLAIAFVKAESIGKGTGLVLWVFIAGLLGFTEKIAVQKQVVQVSDSGINYPNGFGFKKIGWEELEDVTLRTDFLTLHYPGNKLLQFELEAPLPPAEMESVQDFCQSHLAGIPGQA